MKCYNCGMELTSYETNCPNCGQPLNNNQVNQSQTNYMQEQNVGIQNVNQNMLNNVNQTNITQNNQMNYQQPQNMTYDNGQNQFYQNQQMGNPNVQNQMYSSSNMMSTNMNYQVPPKDKSKTKKIIILGSLGGILVLLLICCLFLFSDKSLKDGSRTVMIYMVGSNLESESKIATYDIESIDADDIDLEKMHVLLYTGGTSKWHNFVKNDENAIYELTEDGFEKIESYDQKNMGDADTLQEFLDYGYENYESQYYDLILYDHGGAIDGAIYDDFTNDNLSLAEFSSALEHSLFSDKNKLNTVLFRTCLNGTIEVASVFEDYAEYLIASEEVTNGGDSSVLNFLNEIDTSDDAVSYGKKYIKAYESQINDIDPFGFGTMPMYAIIDLSKISKVNELFSKFIEKIDVEKNYSDIVRVRSKLYQYGYTSFDISEYDTVDLYALVEKLDEFSEEDAKKVLDAIDDAIVYNWSKEENSHGLSVYFPYKAKKSIQSAFLKVYKKLDESSSYYKFIGQFNSLSTSNKASSFAATRINNNSTNVSSEKEFTLQLTDEQQRDYAESIYIIFRKTDDEKYNPIYSSDNTQITDDGKLKTNLENNLIKVMDIEDPGFEEYLTIIERTSESKKTLLTTAVLYDFSSDDAENWKTVASKVYFNVEGDEPKIGSYVNIESENGVSGNVINPDDYKVIDFTASSYNILDNNGNYTDEWDNNGEAVLYEMDIKNIKLKKASLSDETYYCIFKIWDIYGNVYYSNLLNIN